MTTSVYVVVGLIHIAGGSVWIWVHGMVPATVDSVVGRAVGWVLVIVGGAWLCRPLRQGWIQLKPVWRGPWRVRRRRRRSRQGLCVKCGYNLKGLSHLRCPECGHQNVPYEEFDEYAPLDHHAEE